MCRIFFTFLIAFLFTCSKKKEALILNDKIEEKLLYISSRGNGFDIYTNGINGDEESMFTNAPGYEWMPRYIKSKNLVLYNCQDTLGNFSMKATSLTGEDIDFDTKGIQEFEISENGEWIAYTKKQVDNTHILVAPYKLIKDSIQITEGNGYNGRPTFNKDGSNLAFISDRTGTNEIFIYNIKKKETFQLTNNDRREKYMSWSQDGKTLACTFSDDDGENADIFLIDITSKKVKQLTSSTINESEIAWSPTNKYIAYHAQIDEKDDIFLLNLDNNKITKITNGEGYHGEPEWFQLTNH